MLKKNKQLIYRSVIFTHQTILTINAIMKKLKQFLSLFLLVFVPALAFSQKTVTGKVTDGKDNSPLAEATVSVVGKSVSTKTGADGSFTISVPDGSNRLKVSYVGYGDETVSISGNVANISMTSSAQALTDVVVIGYGTARKKDLTGSVASVGEKDFNKGVFASPDQLIQGKVSGVQVISNSGQPGGAATIRIRGASALTGSGNPLFVIDGVPIDNTSSRPGMGDVGFGGSNPGTNILNFINPSDILSMDILKDASATAIYGSRAAYGVVLITTKKGKSGETKIDFGASMGMSSVLKKIKVLNADEYREAIKYYGVSSANDKKSTVDAFDAITRKGMIQNYNVAMSGGVENSRFRISLSALNQEGIVRKSGITKYTANISAQFKFLNSRKLGLDVNILPSQYAEEIAPISNNAGSRGSLIVHALQWNPTEDMIIKRASKPDSFNVQRGGDLFNPLAVQEAYTDKSRVTTLLANISPYYKFTSWLEYRMIYSMNYSTGSRRSSIQPFLNINDVQDKGRAMIANNETSTQQFTHTINIARKINSNIDFSGVIGYEYLKFNNKGYSMNAFGITGTGFGYYGLDFTNYIQFSNPTNRGVDAFADPTSELQSIFARTSFNINEKYLLTATVRRDGSTKFGANNKYGIFPSFSGAWIVSKESFFKVNAINSLKIRAGWGKTGNQEFPSGTSKDRYGFSNGAPAYSLVNNRNPELKWQSDRQYNIGFDVALSNNRINITADYFNKKTTDLLFPIANASAPAIGSSILWKNLKGNVQNMGFEFAINSTIIRKQDFGWDLGVNATFVTNKVSDMEFPILTGEINGQGISNTNVQVVQNGLPMYAYLTREFTGMDKATGFANYTDDGDRNFFVGNSLPKKLLGITTSLRYKMFTLTASANGAFGYKIYNNTLNSVINVGSISNAKNIAYSVFKDPVKESFANPVKSSSRFLESGNYLKLASASLNYNVGKVGNIFNNASVYITGQNLFVITKFTGFDPEVNVNKSLNGVPSASIEYAPYPSAKTVTFGVNFSL